MAKETIENNASLTIISKDTILEGSIQTKGNLRLDGQFKGSIKVNGSFVIGNSGSAIAEIKANSATVAGKLKGNIEVNEQIILEANSIIIGDIISKKLIIRDGAVFHGRNKLQNLDIIKKELEGNSPKNV